MASVTTMLLVLLMASVLTVQSSSRKQLRIGVILPYDDTYQWGVRRVRAGLEIATEIVRKLQILPGYDITMNFADSKCSYTYGPLAAIEMYAKKSADVFLGLACNYALAPVARYAPHWSIPVISLGGSAEAFDNKIEYKALTRIESPHIKTGGFLQAVIAKWNWKSASLIYEEDRGLKSRTSCYLQTEAIYTALRQSDLGFNIWHKRFGANSDEKLSDIMRNAASNSRVIVMCAGPDYVRELMKEAADLGYTRGGYAFLNIDTTSSTDMISRSWYRADDTIENNNKVKAAFEALLTLTLRTPYSQDYRVFSAEVKRRALRGYNFRYGVGEVSHYAGDIHDAMILYALALNETLAAGSDISNGIEVTSRMWNRTFNGITGTVSIDANGDRNGDYSLMDLNPATGTFEAVANYYGNKKQYEPVRGQSIHWPGNGGPPDDNVNRVA